MALTQVTSIGLKDGEIVNADLHSAAAIALSKLADTGALGSAITATTQSASDDTTKLATTAFVQAAVTSLIDGAPGSLNTLNELAAAINDDSSYATTLTTALATKAPLASPTFTGTVAAGVTNLSGELRANGNIKITNSGPKITFTDSGHNPDYMIQNADGALIFNDVTNAANRLVINTDGNILPGTNNATSIGDGSTNFNSIWASTRFRGNDNVKLVLGSSQNLVIRYDGSNNIIGSPVANDLHIKSGTGDNDNQLIATFKHSNASVGIGTTPSYKLHVAEGTTDVVASFTSSDANAWIQFRDDHTNDTAVMIGANDDSMMLRAGSDTRMLIAHNGKVGIGIDDPASNLHVSGASGVPALIIENTDNSAREAAIYLKGKHSNGTVRQLMLKYDSNDTFRIHTAGSMHITVETTDAIHTRFHGGNAGDRHLEVLSGNLKLASGHGINFHDYGSGTDINSNLLNDYEEGVFSPTPNGSGQTYSWRRGRYTKIGNTVFFWFDVSWTGMSSGMADGRINNLPFSGIVSYLHAGYGAVSFRAMTGLESDMRIYGNSSYIGGDYIQLQHFNSSGTIVLTDFLASGRVTGEGFYFVNGAY